MNTTQPDSVWSIIDSAITTQRVIQIKQNKNWRTLEPYLFGFPKEGRKQLTIYGYCLDIVPDAHTPSRWQMVELENVEEIELTNYWFQPRADYTGQADLMQTIFCQLIEQKKRRKKRLNKPAVIPYSAN
ncbi:hypothetical protein [Spirosoma panaciterrae]|uniref:hypothetical protein n=1 Tax=Spirosoma panaciterrae TaxID=496058 RepID=UPI000360B32B|nr:hypothetical protein [Spirosoma panaciterrae]